MSYMAKCLAVLLHSIRNNNEFLLIIGGEFNG